eukprot:CAMPEP_0171243292 /NCGR_PEP_ID=MMETSP0790-20130122/46207_1 /TAXON_ID=2925 /ORGANISM="Alexandrium catenella, Strain OF101" /LENGTH=138 /DNA_ID=CAMNT_0011710271 /DNA_START=134 /DNA_END=551 /DNA_ORIENTATION=+
MKGRDGNRDGCRSVSLAPKLQQACLAVHVPDPGGPIIGACSDGKSIGRHRHRWDATTAALQRELALPPASTPDLCGAVGGARDYEATVGRERNGADGVQMTVHPIQIVDALAVPAACHLRCDILCADCHVVSIWREGN